MTTVHVLNRRILAFSVALFLPLTLATTGCSSTPLEETLVAGDQGTWEPWQVLESSHSDFPDWVNSPPAGKVIAEGSARRIKDARRLANVQLVQNAGLVAGVQIQSEFTRFDTQDTYRANSKTSYSLNAEISVEVNEVYWERRQTKGIQLGLPTTKNEYRVLLLGALSR